MRFSHTGGSVGRRVCKIACEALQLEHGVWAILRTRSAPHARIRRCRDIGAQTSKSGYSSSRLYLLTGRASFQSNISNAVAGLSCPDAQPFRNNAICILPVHLHAIWTLPPGDADFASRWSQIKADFSGNCLRRNMA
jgi:hypothetical protein